MATVGELVVKLTLQSGDVRGQIQQLNREMKSIDASYAATAARAGGFATGTERAQASASMLTSKLAVQNRMVALTGSELQKAQGKLSSSRQSYDEYGRKLDEARKHQADLKDETGRLAQQMQESAARGGDNTEEYIGMSLRMDELGKASKDCAKQVGELESKYTAAGKAVAGAETGVQKASIAYNNAVAGQKQLQRELDGTNAKLKGHVFALEDASKKLDTFGKKATAQGKALTTVLTVPIAAAGVASGTAAIAWESDFAGVRKTVNGTAEELKVINDELLSMKVPASFSTLAGIAGNAGQLGIATENVVDFTRTMADLQETTNLTADAASSDFAKFANITKMPQTAFGNMGSSVVALGNNLATTEADTMNMAMNLAAAGTQAGMTQAQILGLSAGLSSLGLEAQAGGTAFSKTLSAMQVAVETGSKDIKKYADVAGMSVDGFKTMFQGDAAGALTAFISGLSTGSKSAIVMLDEMGIVETRMRDALLRAAGASDVMTNAINLSSEAWSENTALANEAEVRYGTMQSRLTMIGKECQKAAITFGNDLMPAIEDGADAAEALVEKFNNLDEATRKQILDWAGFAAAIGPVWLAVGKGATGLSKFTASMAAAGGGMKGLVGACGKMLGPGGIAALTLAVGYGVYKWAEYASGAKKAQEAIAGMAETAAKWKGVQGNSMFSTSEGLGAFGMDASSFSRGAGGKSWLDSVIAEWTNGKTETSAVVKQYADSYKAETDKVREAVEGVREKVSGTGVEGKGKYADIDKDVKRLNQIDKEVEGILKKRQGGTLTEKDQQKLTDLNAERDKIQIKYELIPAEGGGYAEIAGKVQSAVARAQAEGKEVSPELYKDATVAMAQGYAEVTRQIDAAYDSEYQLIQGLDDEKEKAAALAALNEKHSAAKREAAAEYARSQAGVTDGLFAEGGEMSETMDKMNQLNALILEIKAAGEGGATPEMLAELDSLTKGLDEGKLASYTAALSAMAQAAEDAEIDPSELFPEVDITALLGGYSTIGEYFAANVGTFPDLNQMFNESLPEETKAVLVNLNMTGADAAWDTWATDKSVFVKIDGLPDSVEITGEVTKATVKAGLVAGGMAEAEAEIKAANVMAGLAATGKASATGEVTKASVKAGLIASGMTEAKAEVTAAETMAGLTASGMVTAKGQITQADVKLGLVANGMAEAKANVVAATVADGLKATGKATITQAEIAAGLTASGMAKAEAEVTAAAVMAGLVATGTASATGEITQAGIAEGLVAGGMAEAEAEVKAATIMDGLTASGKTQATGEVTQADIRAGLIATGMTSANAEVVAAKVMTGLTASGSVGVVGNVSPKLESTALAAFKANTKIDGLSGYVGYVGVMPGREAAIKAAVNAGLLALYGTDGAPIPVTPEAVGAIGASDLVLGTDEDGVLHIVVVPELGSPEGVEASTEKMGEPTQSPLLLNNTSANDTIANLQKIKAAYDELNDPENEDASPALAGLKLEELKGNLAGLEPDKIDAIAQSAANLMAALQGGELSEEDSAKAKEQLQGILDVISMSDQYLGIGNDVTAGIAQGMTAYGFAAEAGTVAANIESAIRGATQTHSPSGMTIPIGTGIAEGVASGMSGYSFAAAGAAVAAGAKAGVGNLSASGMGIGLNFSLGIARGITSGTGFIREAARRAALAAKEAAAAALQVESPSKVGAKIGGYFTEGMAMGITDGKKLAMLSDAAKRMSLGAADAAGGAAAGGEAKTNKTVQHIAVNLAVNVTGADIASDRAISKLSKKLAAHTKRELSKTGVRRT